MFEGAAVPPVTVVEIDLSVDIPLTRCLQCLRDCAGYDRIDPLHAGAIELARVRDLIGFRRCQRPVGRCEHGSYWYRALRPLIPRSHCSAITSSTARSSGLRRAMARASWN